MQNKELRAGQRIFDPRGEVTCETRSLAPRVAELAGLRLGVLDNSKWNAGKLLLHMVTGLEESGALAEVSYYKKESFSRAAPPALLEEIAARSDIVLTAIGD